MRYILLALGMLFTAPSVFASESCFIRGCDNPLGQWCVMGESNPYNAIYESTTSFDLAVDQLQYEASVGHCDIQPVGCFIRRCDNPASNTCLMAHSNPYNAVYNSINPRDVLRKLQRLRRQGICQ